MGGSALPTIDAGALSAFRSFARRAATLVPRSELTPEAFREFVTRATPLVIEQVRTRLDARRSRAEALVRTVVRHDLLEVAGYSGREVAYSELLRWLIAPETHPESALARQRVLLDEIARSDRRLNPFLLASPVDPITNYAVPGFGIADLVLLAPTLAVVVEAKTGTEEHETPAGTYQTVAYEAGLRHALQLAPGTHVAVVLLAPELRVPENPLAVPMTFVRLAAAFAEALPPLGLDDETTWAFRSALTHLVVHAAPRSARHMRDGIRAAARYLSASGDAERRAVVRHDFDVLVALVGALEGP